MSAAPAPESRTDAADPWSEERLLDSAAVELDSDGELSHPSPAADESLPGGDRPPQDDGKHSLLQFAMLHFRDAEEK